MQKIDLLSPILRFVTIKNAIITIRRYRFCRYVHQDYPLLTNFGNRKRERQMKEQYPIKNKGVYPADKHLNAKGKENFSRTMLPEYLKVSEICVHTHILTASNPRVNILIFNQSAKRSCTSLRTDCLFPLRQAGQGITTVVPCRITIPILESIIMYHLIIRL